MAVNASESIQTCRELPNLDGSQQCETVGTVYNELDQLEKNISTSFQTLMEYRDVPPSPSTSSVTSASASGLDALSSPTTPASPVPEEMDDERLPNELLEEICEDMGIKDSMDIDLIDFMMDQTSQMINVQSQDSYYSSAMEPASHTKVGVLDHPGSKPVPPRVASQEFNNIPPPICHTAGKQMHSGLQTQTLFSKMQSMSPPCTLHQGFKVPQTTPNQMSVPSNVHSRHYMDPSQVRGQQNTCLHSQSSVPQKCCCSNTHHLNCSQSETSLTRSVTFSQCPPSLPNSNLNKYHPMGNGSTKQNTCPTMSGKPSNIYHHNPCNVQPQKKFGRPSPPVVNVQNMQQLKFGGNNGQMLNSKLSHSGCLHQPGKTMTNSQRGIVKFDEQQLLANQKHPGRTLESPLDQGYFSGDSCSVKSYSSASSLCQSSDMLSSKDNLVIKTEMSSQGMYSRTDLPEQRAIKKEPMMPSPLDGHNRNLSSHCNQNSSQSMSQTQYGFNTTVSVSDCSQKSVQSKILPRLTPSVKSEVAPYIIPSNNGQATINPYDDFIQGNQLPGPVLGQSGLENPSASLEFPTNFGKEVVNVKHNQNSPQGGGTNYVQDFHAASIPATNCVPVGPSYSVPTNAQQSADVAYNNYSSAMVPSMSQTPFYQGGCIQKTSETLHSVHNCVYSGMQHAQHMAKPFKQEQDNLDFSVNNQYSQNSHCGNSLTLTNNSPQSWQAYQMNVATQPNSRFMCARPAIRQPSPHCIQTNMSHNLSDHNLSSNMMEIRNRPGVADINRNHVVTPQQQQQMSINGNVMQIRPHGWSRPVGQAPQTLNQISQQMSQAKIPSIGVQPMQFPHPSESNCPIVSTNCKLSHRPPILSSQEAFIEHLIMDKSSAYRSHPLFPLLRDLMITYMNFNSQSIHYQLIQHLPSEFERLLQNFLNRNPPRGGYQSNYAVESVIMDALRFAHSSLIDKIRSKQEQDKHIKGASQSITAIEEFCEKFDRAVHNAVSRPVEPGPCIHGNHSSNGQHCGSQVFCGSTQYMTDPSKGPRLAMEVLKEQQPDSMSDAGSVVSSSSNHSNKSESKKHPSLPKEAVAIMLEWLRNHKDNPYPNDDEKAMLIKQTGLTINQINYWFTNARRRILPKWAQAQQQSQIQTATPQVQGQPPVQIPSKSPSPQTGQLSSLAKPPTQVPTAVPKPQTPVTSPTDSESPKVLKEEASGGLETLVNSAK